MGHFPLCKELLQPEAHLRSKIAKANADLANMVTALAGPLVDRCNPSQRAAIARSLQSGRPISLIQVRAGGFTPSTDNVIHRIDRAAVRAIASPDIRRVRRGRGRRRRSWPLLSRNSRPDRARASSSVRRPTLRSMLLFAALFRTLCRHWIPGMRGAP